MSRRCQITIPMLSFLQLKSWPQQKFSNFYMTAKIFSGSYNAMMSLLSTSAVKICTSILCSNLPQLFRVWPLLLYLCLISGKHFIPFVKKHISRKVKVTPQKFKLDLCYVVISIVDKLNNIWLRETSQVTETKFSNFSFCKVA